MEHYLYILLLIVAGFWLLVTVLPYVLIGVIFLVAFGCYLWDRARKVFWRL